MKTYDLKLWPKYFKEVIAGNKTFELRLNDRNFLVGDIVTLNEYDPDKKEYTGEKLQVVITYVLPLFNFFQIKEVEEYCVFSFARFTVDYDEYEIYRGKGNA